MNILRFAQLSDFHLYKDKDFISYEHNTYQSFCAVTGLLKQEKNALDLIIVTGDMAANMEKEAYFHADKVLASFNLPYYWLPGNHDDAALMKSIHAELSVQGTNVFDIKGTRFILLDSSDRENKAMEGFLPEYELHFLEKSLAEAPQTPTIIALHHQLLDIPNSWATPYGLTNKEDFYRITDAHPQIKAVICGHIHYVENWERNGVQYFSAPATSYQFDPYTTEPGITNALPGYQTFSIDHHTDTINCEVKRVS